MDSRNYRDRADDSLFSLIGDIPGLVRNLVVAEFNAVKGWVGNTAKDAGIGTIWFVAALFFLFWTVPVFQAFLIAGLASWMPVWLAALAVVGVSVLIIVVLAVFGVLRMRRIKKRESPARAIQVDSQIVKDVIDEY